MNVIISESGYIRVFLTNLVKNMVSICRVDSTLTVFPSQTGCGTHSLACTARWNDVYKYFKVYLRVYPNILV